MDEFLHIKHPKKRVFLEAFVKTGVMDRARQTAQVGRSAPYRWQKSDPEFAEALELARFLVGEYLKDSANERAIYGHKRLKFNSDGEAVIDPRTGKVYEEQHYETGLTIFLLKHYFPYLKDAEHEDDGREVIIRIEREAPYGADQLQHQAAPTGAPPIAAIGESGPVQDSAMRTTFRQNGNGRASGNGGSRSAG